MSVAPIPRCLVAKGGIRRTMDESALLDIGLAVALEHHISYMTNLNTFRAAVAAMRTLRLGQLTIRALHEVTTHSLKA